MKTGLASTPTDLRIGGFPGADELAMLRAWYVGMPFRKAVERYLPQRFRAGQSARGVLGGIRRRLAKVAQQVGRPDLAAAFEHPDGERLREVKTVAAAIGILWHARLPVPQIAEFCHYQRGMCYCRYRGGGIGLRRANHQGWEYLYVIPHELRLDIRPCETCIHPRQLRNRSIRTPYE
jgi:hypothetical protein